jgi:hypothetical protein
LSTPEATEAMQKKTNSRELLAEVREALQAREILQALDRLNGTANDDLLCEWLAKIGLAVARHGLADLLDRLEREGLVHSHEVDSRRVVRLAREGREVAQDITRCEWISPSV